MITPVLILQFLVVSLVAPAPVPILAKLIAVGLVVFVFVIVKSREAVPLFEPSIVTKSAPFSFNIEAVVFPVITEFVTPVAGLMVRVFVELAFVYALIERGSASLALTTEAPPDNAVVGVVETTN